MKRRRTRRIHTRLFRAFAIAGLLWSIGLPGFAEDERCEAGIAQQPTQAKTAQKTPEPAEPLVTDTVEFRDAPFRSALQLLFAANNRQFSIYPTVGNYDSTFSFKNLPLSESMRAYNEKGPSAFQYVVESGTYIVHPARGETDKPTPKETLEMRYGKNKTHRVYKKERDVVRRLSGLLRHEVRTAPNAAPTTTYFALLETTDLTEEYKDTSIRVVAAGTQISSDLDNRSMVRVIKVDANGVKLQPSHDKAFTVRFAPLSAVQE